MISMILKRAAIAAASVAMTASVAFAIDISGAGHLPLSDLCEMGGYVQEETGSSLNYQSIGSGGGIKQVKARTVTFGASDQPLKPRSSKPRPHPMAQVIAPSCGGQSRRRGAGRTHA